MRKSIKVKDRKSIEDRVDQLNQKINKWRTHDQERSSKGRMRKVNMTSVSWKGEKDHGANQVRNSTDSNGPDNS